MNVRITDFLTNLPPDEVVEVRDVTGAVNRGFPLVQEDSVILFDGPTRFDGDFYGERYVALAHVVSAVKPPSLTQAEQDAINTWDLRRLGLS
jgi:hypothetical protein